MSWTERWMCFDNSYFQRPRGQPQGIDSKELLWLPTDRALHEDPELRVYFERYAVDQALFFRDYAAAHRRMSELGCRFQEPGPISVTFPPISS
jgi:L-ascorbate peroxidase